MIQAVYGLPVKCVGYMGRVWVYRRNKTHTLPITRQLWVVFLQSENFISILSVFLFLSVSYYSSRFPFQIDG